MSPNLQAFLRVIREGESSQADDAYWMIVGGGRAPSLADHPRQLVTLPKLGVRSTAAGAYQFLSRTWDECAKALRLQDFSPASQDAAAVYLITRRKALADVEAGNLEAALAKCAREWASLPGSPYGQPTMPLKRAVAAFLRWGGTLAPTPGVQPPPSPKEGTTMAPFVAAAIPALINLIPRLAELFGSGSDVSNRNVKAAEMVVGIVQDAVGARNAQEAVEIIKEDPQALQTATKAVEAKWLDLTDAGGDGIAGARKQDLTMSGGSMLASPSFWIALALLPLVYMIVANVVGLIGKPLSDEVRSAISNGVVGLILGGLIGYYYGQTTSRNREK